MDKAHGKRAPHYHMFVIKILLATLKEKKNIHTQDSFAFRKEQIDGLTNPRLGGDGNITNLVNCSIGPL